VSRVKLTKLARRDLQEIGDYIARDNRNAALSFVQRLKRRCTALGQSPGVGRKRDELEPDLRSAAEGNYIIFYRQRGNGIEVVRIIHGKMDIGKSAFVDPESS
jgi:toxin ParE1/3/4